MTILNGFQSYDSTNKKVVINNNGPKGKQVQEKWYRFFGNVQNKDLGEIGRYNYKSYPFEGFCLWQQLNPTAKRYSTWYRLTNKGKWALGLGTVAASAAIWYKFFRK